MFNYDEFPDRSQTASAAGRPKIELRAESLPGSSIETVSS